MDEYIMQMGSPVNRQKRTLFAVVMQGMTIVDSLTSRPAGHLPGRNGRDDVVVVSYREAYCITGRRSGKSRTAAAVATYIAALAPHLASAEMLAEEQDRRGGSSRVLGRAPRAGKAVG